MAVRVNYDFVLHYTHLNDGFRCFYLARCRMLLIILKLVVSDSTDSVNIVCILVRLSVLRITHRNISQSAVSLIVGPVFSKHIGSGKVCMLCFNYRWCNKSLICQSQDRSRRISTLGLFFLEISLLFFFPVRPLRSVHE